MYGKSGTFKENCLGFLNNIDDFKGDEIFGRIVDCLGDDVMRFARRRCGNEADAEEAVQDALTAAYRYLEGFRGEASVKTWLFKLAASACTKKRRGMKNDPDLHMDLETVQEQTGDEAAGARRADLMLLIKEKYEVLAQILERLPETDRELLLLHQGEELPLEVLAERFGLSLNAVKSRLFRTRRRLKDELTAAGLEG